LQVKAQSIAEDTMTCASAIRRVLVVLSLGLLLPGCQRTNRWQEEVQLSDGTVLKVDRAVSYRAPSGALGQPSGRRALEERLSFADPGTDHHVEWHESRRTVFWLDRIDTHVWLVARLSTPCESGFGHLPVWQAYLLHDEQWHAVGPADLPVVPLRNLLTTDYPVSKQLGYVSLADKQRLNAPHPQDLIDWARKNGC
jgi:hypothetical protein